MSIWRNLWHVRSMILVEIPGVGLDCKGLQGEAGRLKWPRPPEDCLRWAGAEWQGSCVPMWPQASEHPSCRGSDYLHKTCDLGRETEAGGGQPRHVLLRGWRGLESETWLVSTALSGLYIHVYRGPSVPHMSPLPGNIQTLPIKMMMMIPRIYSICSAHLTFIYFWAPTGAQEDAMLCVHVCVRPWHYSK